MRATSRNVDAELHIELHGGLDRRVHRQSTRRTTMSDRYQDFVSSPRRPAAGEEPRPAQPGRGSTATPRARRWSTAPSSSAAPAGSAEPLPGIARRASASPPSRRRRGGRHATRAWSSTPPASPTPTELVALQRVLHPAAAQPRDLPARRRARHPARSRSTGEERVAQRALEGFTR